MMKEDSLVQLFSKFIADFESKINPLSLVQLGMVALEQHEDSEQAIKFIERIGEKVNWNPVFNCLVDFFCKNEAFL